MRRHEDDVNGRIEFHDSFQNLHARQLGHYEICENDLGMTLKNEVEAVFRVCRGNNIHTLPCQRAGHEFDAAGVVIDYDDAHVGLRTGAHLPLPYQQSIPTHDLEGRLRI